MLLSRQYQIPQLGLKFQSGREKGSERDRDKKERGRDLSMETEEKKQET